MTVGASHRFSQVFKPTAAQVCFGSLVLEMTCTCCLLSACIAAMVPLPKQLAWQAALDLGPVTAPLVLGSSIESQVKG